MTVNITNDRTYGLLKGALDASSLRQRTMSNNIANINTKDYKARKVVFEEELKKSIRGESIGLNSTNSRHMGFEKVNDLVEPKIVKDQSDSMRSDGNNVDVDLEMANMAANQILYNVLVQQTSKKISNLRYAIQGGR